MTALIDKPAPVAEAPPAPIDSFVMPKPVIGQTVLWYPNADKNGDPEVTIVRKRGHRTIVVGTALGVNREAVRHVDDPKLRQSLSQRESGAWDFTERDKQYGDIVNRISTLEAKYAELEDLIAGGKKKKPE